MIPFYRSSSLKKGFSLVELIVVVAIMALLTSVSIPSFRNMSKSTAMADSIRSFTDVLKVSQQTALTFQKPVLLCFYMAKSPDIRKDELMAVQSYIFKNEMWTPLQKIWYTPQDLYFDSDIRYSTLLQMEEKEVPDRFKTPLIIRRKFDGVKVLWFWFLPSGGTNLPKEKDWYMTIYPRNTEFNSERGTPKYFCTFNINPTTGYISTIER